MLVRNSLARILQGAGYELDTAENCGAAHKKLSLPFQLFILDIWLPDGDGISLCREIRQATQAPVLFLSACEDEASVMEGLRAGGDDYVIKPFRSGELLARMEALLRRSGYQKGKTALRTGGLTLLPEEGRVLSGGAEWDLTAMEYQVLELLVRHKGGRVSREQFLRLIWDGKGSFVEDNTLSVCVSRLRRKLAKAGCRDAIETCWGSGYRWLLPVEETQER